MSWFYISTVLFKSKCFQTMGAKNWYNQTVGPKTAKLRSCRLVISSSDGKDWHKTGFRLSFQKTRFQTVGTKNFFQTFGTKQNFLQTLSSAIFWIHTHIYFLIFKETDKYIFLVFFISDQFYKGWQHMGIDPGIGGYILECGWHCCSN